MQQTFSEKAMRNFQYLIDDFRFEIGDVSNSSRDPRTEGSAEYQSSTTFISVSGEIPSSVSVLIGRIKDPRYKFLIDLELVYEYLTLNKSENKLVLSRDPKDDYQISVTLDLHSLNKRVDFRTNDERLDYKLSNYGVWLRKYAEPFLRGDFSRWFEIYTYKVEKMIAEYARNNKDTSILYVSKIDENNKPIHEKKSVFQNSLDYLDSLRKEL